MEHTANAAAAGGTAATVLAVGELCKRYGDKVAVDGISFSVGRSRSP